MLPQQYCLKWKYHNNNIQFTFSQLLEKGSFCDVTIWCGGVAFRAHRAVLASCSALLSSLLDSHDASWGEPALVLEKTEARHLTQLLAFMYTGEVSVHHTELAGLLKTAEDLQIKGLADVSWKDPKNSKVASQNQHPEDPLALGPGYNQWSNTENAATPVSHKKGLDKDNGLPTMTALNGSLVVPPLQLAQNNALLDAVKRKRGRPPLEPIDVEQHSSPKRNKIPELNALKKSDRSSDVSGEWTDANTSQKNEESELAEELSSDYSDASLDGDISQFLDTTMEVEGNGEVNTGDNLIGDPLRINNRESTSAMSSESFSEKSNEKKEVPPQFADVVKLSDYLVRGRRPQFWAEDYVKRVMEAVFCKELEMKQAAELLGVSYGTLYGRYRDCFGCINRPYRVRDFWSEQGPSEVVAKLLKKEISLFKAAEILNVSPQTLSSYLVTLSEEQTKAVKTANGENSSRKSDEEDVKPSIDLKEVSTDKHQLSILPEHHVSEDESEPESDDIDANPPVETKKSDDDKLFFKTPVIRVADLKFLKGDTSADTKDKEESDSVARILKNHPDLTMIPAKRKVTFQDQGEGEGEVEVEGDGEEEEEEEEEESNTNANGDGGGGPVDPIS